MTTTSLAARSAAFKYVMQLIPNLVADRNAALFRLATLTGRTPQELPASVQNATVTPNVTQPIPVGDGQALLARRPDVRAAERHEHFTERAEACSCAAALPKPPRRPQPARVLGAAETRGAPCAGC